MSQAQQQWELVDQLTRHPGWQLLQDRLQVKQQEADRQYRKTDDKNHQKLADGIDALWEEINTIKNQGKLDQK